MATPWQIYIVRCTPCRALDTFETRRSRLEQSKTRQSKTRAAGEPQIRPSRQHQGQGSTHEPKKVVKRHGTAAAWTPTPTALPMTLYYYTTAVYGISLETEDGHGKDLQDRRGPIKVLAGMGER